MFEKKIEYCSKNSFRIACLENKINRLDIKNYTLESELEVFKIEIQELRNILREAGIIVTPPKNISVPDPRGYSINKIK